VLGAVGVIVGIPVGMAFMMFLHWLTTFVYPMPSGVELGNPDPENMARVNEWLGTLPAGAFLLATICHGFGCMLGAVIATFVSSRQSLIPAIVVGVVFTAFGIANLFSIPHPSWFPIVDVPVYLVFAVAVGLKLKKKVASDSAHADESTA